MKKIAIFAAFAALATFTSCEEDSNAIPGCTDATATNYMPSATEDDGSCTYAVYGCTDATATNYNAAATNDDGSCAYAADAYAGTYSVSEECSQEAFTYEQEITANGNEITLVNAFGWSAGADNDVTIEVASTSFSYTGVPTIIEGPDGTQYNGAYDLEGQLDGETLTIAYMIYLDFEDGEGLVAYDACMSTMTIAKGGILTPSKKYLNL